jgi:hypothetical protein
MVELVNSRNLPKELTWENLQSVYNIQKIEGMKKEHEGDLEGLLSAYSEELGLTTGQLKDAEAKIKYLERELRTEKFSKPISNGITPSAQVTQAYPDEIKLVIAETLKGAAANTYKGSRRAKILGEIAKSMNSSSEERDKRVEEIKKMFRGYKRLTAPMRNELEKMGFVLSEEGGHYKLALESDPNGCYVTLAKTPSDHRTGANTSAEIIRIFF